MAAAAAALRCAARRLGGRELQLQQRTYAAGLEGINGNRAVWPTSSLRSRSSACPGAANRSTMGKKSTAGPNDQKNELLNEIQYKKEELFNMIAKVDKLPSRYTRDNLHLLMYLSEQIQPKPNDPQWCFYRRAIRLNRYFQYGSILFLGYMANSNEISQGESSLETGFLPQYHLLKLCDADMPRLFIPEKLVFTCSLYPGDEVALVDCLGRTRSASVESYASVFYLGRGWTCFLQNVGAKKGDSLLFKFLGARTCKISVFNSMFGWQKYPRIEDEHRNLVLNPIEPRCFFSGGWPQPESPSRAIDAGPCTMASASSSAVTPFAKDYQQVCDGNVCNATGEVIDRIMLEFLEDLVRGRNLQMPLYYCKLGLVELESGFLSLDRGFSLSHISLLMGDSFKKQVIIQRAEDAPVKACLFSDVHGIAHISEGWINFVRQQAIVANAECILEFYKVDDTIKVAARIVYSSASSE